MYLITVINIVSSYFTLSNFVYSVINIVLDTFTLRNIVSNYNYR